MVKNPNGIKKEQPLQDNKEISHVSLSPLLFWTPRNVSFVPILLFVFRRNIGYTVYTKMRDI